MTPFIQKKVEEAFDTKFPEGVLGHKHNEDCEWLCCLRPRIKYFIAWACNEALLEQQAVIRGKIEANFKEQAKVCEEMLKPAKSKPDSDYQGRLEGIVHFAEVVLSLEELKETKHDRTS